MDSRHHRTYQCRITVDDAEATALESYAHLYGKAARTLIARLQSGGTLIDLKREFLRRFGITARQYNAMAFDISGKIASVKERRAGLIEEMEHRVERAKAVLTGINDPFKLHQKKRRLTTLESRLSGLQSDHATGVVRLCFGSRKLFRAQFSLEENGYGSLAAWKEDWQSARDHQFFVIGSKDETGGCQGCVATAQSDGSITLRLRLPNASGGKYAMFRGHRFSHGHGRVLAVTCPAKRQGTAWDHVACAGETPACESSLTLFERRYGHMRYLAIY